jgi:broad specificity phosphatase PhoE
MTTSPETSLSRIAFWYLRHGETDWNAQGLSQGNVDIPLNATGISQARAAGPMLRNRGIASIFASPLSRARVTADIVAESLGLPVTVDRDLREVSWGVQEGQAMSGWFTDWVTGSFAPQGGESFPALRQRAVAAVNRSLQAEPVVLVVAHGALFRALRAAMGVEPNMRTRNAVPMWCAPPAAGQTGWTIEYTT